MKKDKNDKLKNWIGIPFNEGSRPIKRPEYVEKPNPPKPSTPKK